jgi:hypothetical protein
MSISEDQQKTISSNHKIQTPNQTHGDPWHRAFHYDIVIMDAQTLFGNKPSASARCSAITHRRNSKGYRITDKHKLREASETSAITTEDPLHTHQCKLEMADIGSSIVSQLVAATIYLVLLPTPHSQLHITSYTSWPTSHTATSQSETFLISNRILFVPSYVWRSWTLTCGAASVRTQPLGDRGRAV